VGKARLSLFHLRPRTTAVVITAMTGALISAISLGLMLLVDERLRVGLFELDQLQDRLSSSRLALERNAAELRRSRRDLRRSEAERLSALRSEHLAESQRREAQSRVAQLRQGLLPLQAERRRLEQERLRLNAEVSGKDQEIRRNEQELQRVRQRISAGEKELKGLENNVIALRRGDVVIASGQPLAMAKVKLQRPDQSKDVIDAMLQQANLSAFQRLLPGRRVDRQILLVPRVDIERLATLLAQPGTWVVTMVPVEADYTLNGSVAAQQGSVVSADLNEDGSETVILEPQDAILVVFGLCTDGSTTSSTVSITYDGSAFQIDISS